MQNTDFPFERSQTVEYGPTGPVFMQGCHITAESRDIKKKRTQYQCCVFVSRAERTDKHKGAYK